MEYLWLIYWSFLLFSLFFGINVMIKKNRLTGILEIILSLIIPIWAVIFSLKRDYLENGYGENEIKFFYDELINCNIEAILIILLFLCLISLLIYNVILFRKKN